MWLCPAQGRRSELERTLRSLASLASIHAILALVVFVLFGGLVMGVVYGPFYRAGAAVLAILSVGRIVAVATGSCGVVLMMTGQERAIMTITLLTGIASVAAGVLLASRFGPVGVAAATSSGIILNNLLQLYFAHRLVGVWTHLEVSPRRLYDFVRPKSEGTAA
jgi:O-antigen/teichoic acid export membrane protein